MKQSCARIVLIVICISGAIVIAAESRWELNPHWEWSIPPLVAVAVVAAWYEITYRFQMAVQRAITLSRKERPPVPEQVRCDPACTR